MSPFANADEAVPHGINIRGSYNPSKRNNYLSLSPKREEVYVSKFDGKFPGDFRSYRYQKLSLWYNYDVLTPTKDRVRKRKALMKHILIVSKCYMKFRKTLGFKTFNWIKKAPAFFEMALRPSLYRKRCEHLLEVYCPPPVTGAGPLSSNPPRTTYREIRRFEYFQRKTRLAVKTLNQHSVA